MENLPKKLHVYVVYSSDGLCAQFFYEILEFVKVAESAKKIACILGSFFGPRIAWLGTVS